VWRPKYLHHMHLIIANKFSLYILLKYIYNDQLQRKFVSKLSPNQSEKKKTRTEQLLQSKQRNQWIEYGKRILLHIRVEKEAIVYQFENLQIHYFEHRRNPRWHRICLEADWQECKAFWHVFKIYFVEFGSGWFIYWNSVSSNFFKHLSFKCLFNTKRCIFWRLDWRASIQRINKMRQIRF